MPSLSIDQLKVLSFGYLTGADLTQWASPLLLIKQYEVDQDSLNRGVQMAYAEVKTQLSTRYDLTAELAKTTGRALMAVKLVSIMAVRNILGNIQNLSDQMLDNYSWADKTLREIRAGQAFLEIVQAPEEKISEAVLISPSFNMQG